MLTAAYRLNEAGGRLLVDIDTTQQPTTPTSPGRDEVLRDWPTRSVPATRRRPVVRLGGEEIGVLTLWPPPLVALANESARGKPGLRGNRQRRRGLGPSPRPVPTWTDS